MEDWEESEDEGIDDFITEDEAEDDF